MTTQRSWMIVRLLPAPNRVSEISTNEANVTGIVMLGKLIDMQHVEREIMGRRTHGLCQTPQPAKYPISYINVLSGQVSEQLHCPLSSLFPPEPTSSFLSGIRFGLTLRWNQNKVLSN